MSAGFTPGPWSVNVARLSDGSINVAHVVAPDRASVVQLSTYGEEETLANARLIAAAPALHKAADLLASFDATGDEAFLRDAIRAAREALAIVRGDQ